MLKEEGCQNSTFSLFNSEIVDKIKNISITMNTLNAENTLDNLISWKNLKFERWIFSF